MKIITAEHIRNFGFKNLFEDALRFLEEDMMRWQSFKKSARHATHFDHGVFELMPCADDAYYTFKYVNAHPANPSKGKLSIVALGMLADVETGYPQMVCDMTLLTAIRTAAMSVLAAKHLAKKDSSVFGLIGTGAQSEFQTYAMLKHFPIRQIRYFDRDTKAMEKYARNMASAGVELVACASAKDVLAGADIVTTCICEKAHVELFQYADLKNHSSLFINAIGGDCPGKTELDPDILRNSRVVVEFYEQTKAEGEIQSAPEVACEELWEIVQGKRRGRTEKDCIVVFDSVGFALADFSVMRMLHERGIGQNVSLLPEPKDAKDLFALVV